MHGVVSAGDPQTAEAGAEILRAGGNAIDAAVAAACASFVCELPLGSPLGGGVCVIERDGVPVAFDMFARTPGLGAPAVEKDFEAVVVSFGAASQTFHVGRASVAVPLALEGLLEIHKRYGQVPLTTVMAPAVALGRQGYVLGNGLAFVFEVLTPIVHRTKECLALFTDEAGAIAKAGTRLFNHDMAQTLEDIAKTPIKIRELQALLTREMGPAHGGLITDDDVRRAVVASHSPVTTEHRGWRLSTMPSPSTGGVLVALGLRLLEGADQYPFLSRDYMHFVAKVQEALLDERDDEFAVRMADPELVRALLADERVKTARDHARKNMLGSTTHISVIDGQANSVSLTLTNGEGSGHVLPGTGMIPNNLLGEQDLHPRGFHVDPAGSGLMTMMAPTLMARGKDRIALGSGGSNRLRTAILQVLAALTEHRIPAHEAVHAPRLHMEPGPRIALEAAGLDPAVVASLREKYPNAAVFDAPNLYFGGVHLAMLENGELSGVGDGRRSGACVKV